ncbi:MAG: ferredoxin [Candidatus ainarchaeum sp.]|nr:ferredoxin [Candidatus ainarchaeum sp.]
MAKVPYVDRDACIGCGTCVAICPAVFQLKDDGKSDVVDAKGGSEAEIQQAIDSCPAQCIHWKK